MQNSSDCLSLSVAQQAVELHLHKHVRRKPQLATTYGASVVWRVQGFKSFFLDGKVLVLILILGETSLHPGIEPFRSHRLRSHRLRAIHPPTHPLTN